MKTLLVPVDFSATSDNAVSFAIEWCKAYGYERVILLKTFYDSIFENLVISAEYVNLNQDYLNAQREQAMEQLDSLCKSVAERVGLGVKVMTAVSEFPLLRGVFELIRNEKPDLIVLGSDNLNNSGGSSMAGNVISIAKASPVRVLVVPGHSQYQPVAKALLPYNTRMLNDLDRLNSFRTAPQWDHLKLLVLNIDTDIARHKEAADKFEHLLKNFEYELYFTADKNVVDSITNFTKEHSVQLIIALPGRHSFLYRLTHASLSQAIYRNATLPVLILK